MRFIRSGTVAAALISLAACSTGPEPELAPVAGTTGATGAQAAAGTGASGVGTAPTSALTVADQAFLTQAAYGGLAEVALGQLAMQRAASPDVRAFGQRMVEEHSRANAELVVLAEAKGMTPPTAPDEGRQAVVAALAALEGAEFDRQYLQQQLAEHQLAVALYDAEASGGTDPDVRTFASRWTPALRDHAGHIVTLMAPAVGMVR
ncbi:DUF4142 domain-containing protein [Arenibaculum sp.]|uniref:DUF4142 domain-containing protein n=1 Tax=Arenibaculum sp. TaxID=2865862 RepID=UPI002E155E56|nr:DUF4142 domain-containing protein [Arenibaculum sp.]